MSLENTLKKQADRLKKEKKEIEKKMEDAPSGDLIIYKSRNRTRWYETGVDAKGKKTRTEIPHTDRSLAEKLAVKKYYTARLQSIEKKLELYNNTLALLDNGHDPVDELLKDEEFAELLRPYYKSDEEKYREWAGAEYIRNEKHPEHLTVNSPHGLLRSKSEYMIFQELDRYGLSARYECRMLLGGIEIFPDFMIRHPVTGEVIIWEHLGLIENQNYRDDFKKKLDLYASAGFYPGATRIIVGGKTCFDPNIIL